jgi:hypothetical protein
MSLKEMLSAELPLNRKERFFTGTVFPMIVCKENFRHLHLLLSLLGVSPTPAIISTADKENFLFFTEYSLVESALGMTKQRFKNLPHTKDTPDIVILIKAETKILVALEAKMYNGTTVSGLNQQMLAQQKILESIQESLSVDKVYHYALLSEKLAKKVEHGLAYPVLTWEAIYKEYEPVCKNDYFFDMLRISLDIYDDLVSSTSISFGRNSEEKLSGQQIYERFKQGTLDKVSIGRSGGKYGGKLKEDITTGKWHTFVYETSSKKPVDLNRNWFWIEDFVNLIDHN